jgi:hypothetical protein
MTLCPVSNVLSNYYSLDIFIEDVGELMIFVLPAAICVVLWKVFVTNRTTPRGNILSLGLDESSATYTELYGRRIPWQSILFYVLIGVATFKLGVFAFEAFGYVNEPLSMEPWVCP